MTAPGGWPMCRCGCDLPVGGGVQLNTSTGLSTRTGPSEDAVRIAELEHEVRVWKFNAETAEQQNSETRKNMARRVAGDRATLARVWALLDHRRKTVRMEDLRAALDAKHATLGPRHPAGTPEGHFPTDPQMPGSADQSTPPGLSGVVLRDVEERDDAAGDQT